MKKIQSTALLFITACIPVPYLTPPAHISIDGYSNPNYTEQTALDGTEEPFATNLALGLTPMGIMPPTMDRSIDIYGGLFLHSSEHLGPFVGVDYWPLVTRLGKRGAFRGGITGRAALMGMDNDWGTHYKAGFTAELTSYIKTEDVFLYQKDPNSLGVLFGEMGIGVDVCVFVDEFEENRLIGSMVSLDVRLPAGAGITFIPIENLKK